ncbi:hypothetical protein Y887_06255 [Xanthomonas pisi DSM 18956]|nr:hypothetical protein Y887_06255 [Xanthomonas pisi DSM 18956]
MFMTTDFYTRQVASWPAEGRHVMAQSDETSITVYQAYRPAIADYAVAHQQFGGEFSYSRMSWVKPNFLWMMYRCGWASKEGQERVLALRLPRRFFDELLQLAVASSYDHVQFSSREQWQAALAQSDVRLQWDPDHDPAGKPVPRRALQLGLRGDVLRRFGSTELISIQDITPFVIEQRANAHGHFERLLTPVETVYHANAVAAKAAGISSGGL